MNPPVTFASKVLSFYKTLSIATKLPNGIEALNPYQDPVTFELCRRFYQKYFDDQRQRHMIIGINPGRFGAGLTGIPFTDPVKLEKICGIGNDLPKKSELSADFIHAMIAAYGGAEKFFSRFYFSSVSPLGFVQDHKNLNYYDSRELLKSLEDFIISSLQRQIQFGISRALAYCLGEGENFRYLARLNEREKFFDMIIPLPHPRFIMQYKRKKVSSYIDMYIEKLSMT